jgi:hypothetical protein
LNRHTYGIWHLSLERRLLWFPRDFMLRSAALSRLLCLLASLLGRPTKATRKACSPRVAVVECGPSTIRHKQSWKKENLHIKERHFLPDLRQQVSDSLTCHRSGRQPFHRPCLELWGQGRAKRATRRFTRAFPQRVACTAQAEIRVLTTKAAQAPAPAPAPAQAESSKPPTSRSVG